MTDVSSGQAVLTACSHYTAELTEVKPASDRKSSAMPRPWTVIESVETDEGPLQLRQRGEKDFLITVGRRVLMSSSAHRSEYVLGEVPSKAVASRPAPSVVIGGLGLGYTLRGALDALPPSARVTVVELNPVVERWCRGPIAPLTGHALDDSRASVINDDIMRHLRSAPATYDAIILDLYEGPNSRTHPTRDPFYSKAAIETMKSALKAKGVLAVWSEQSDRPFEQRMSKAGFKTELLRESRGGFHYAVYLGRL